ncbi:hypothetical protein [Pedobacter montanisoli]|uniref:PorV/PorQ family protein n=1 Tax=Pedobacter montanisoli TaxID=2923277 RepID=A0ABS9ZYY0_9SPHI|nr:hypothetical protein [Pedobacter montanisoli]MCJ0743495.1 hypothetical protein [Pedobacter montanisoli]
MSKFSLSVLTLWISGAVSYAQFNMGPKITSMGLNGASVKDVWSTVANPAGITAIKSATVAINYSKFLFDSELNTQAASLIIPFTKTFGGLSFLRHGFTEYNEIKTGITIGKKFSEHLSIGLRANLHQLSISHYGNSTTFSIDLGAIYTLNNQIDIGAYITNPSRQNFNSSAIANNIATTLNIGASYLASDKVLIAASLSKELQAEPDVRLGIDYSPISLLSLRGGISSRPFKQFFGIGLSYQKIMLDTAIENHPQMGCTPQIGLSYAF